MAFLQLGDSTTSRSWAQVKALDGRDASLQSIIRDVRAAEQGGDQDAFAVLPASKLLDRNRVPGAIGYHLVADYPAHVAGRNPTLDGTVCVFWP